MRKNIFRDDGPEEPTITLYKKDMTAEESAEAWAAFDKLWQDVAEDRRPSVLLQKLAQKARLTLAHYGFSEDDRHDSAKLANAPNIIPDCYEILDCARAMQPAIDDPRTGDWITTFQIGVDLGCAWQRAEMRGWEEDRVERKREAGKGSGEKRRDNRHEKERKVLALYAKLRASNPDGEEKEHRAGIQARLGKKGYSDSTLKRILNNFSK